MSFAIIVIIFSFNSIRMNSCLMNESGKLTLNERLSKSYAYFIFHYPKILTPLASLSRNVESARDLSPEGDNFSPDCQKFIKLLQPINFVTDIDAIVPWLKAKFTLR